MRNDNISYTIIFIVKIIYAITKKNTLKHTHPIEEPKVQFMKLAPYYTEYTA